MHMVTFSIVLFELVILFFQLIYYLERPGEKSRLWYLILLYLLIQYNVLGGLFPADNIPISIILQNILAYASAIMMSMYFAFYFYKAFELEHFRWFAIYGTFYFVFLPFIAAFIIPYYLTGDLELSRKLFVVIPFMYCLVFIYNITHAVVKKYNNALQGEEGYFYKERIISVYIALTFWISLPIITYFNGGQVLEVCMTNAGFLVMTIMYIRSTVFNSKAEYHKLQVSEQNLQKLNKELQKKVEERTKKLTQMNEQKTHTLINLAHETKTPLTLINNYLDEYITRYGINEELAVIKFNTDKLTNDIVNLFDLERFEKGIEVYDHDQVTDFSLILTNSLILFKSLALHKQIQVSEHIEDNVLIKAAPEGLSRIINNLIENAIKYTERGEEIEVQLMTQDENIIFSVSDTGIGIPASVQDKIFEPYFQINNQKRNTQGLGMGLSIVKKIVDSLHGFIKIDSNRSAGTKITVKLPNHELIEDNHAKDVQRNSHLRLQMTPPVPEDSINHPDAPYILIVEDNLSMLNYLASKLKEKFNIYVAENGAKALEKLETVEQLDLILSDIMMDTVDGFKLYQIVMEKRAFSHIPFIFLTAKSTKKDKLQGLSMGAIDYIEKPFSISELMHKLDAVLANLMKQREALVNKAYKSMLSKVSAEEQIRDDKACFEENCKNFNLTSRETEIVRLIAQGKTYHAIADVLYISDKTVAKHIQNIFSKVKVKSKIDLVNQIKAPLS